MKHLLFLLALIASVPTFAQRGEIVSDSSYTELISNKYYAVRQITYENGDLTVDKTLTGVSGTADEAYRYTLGQITQGTVNMANDAVLVSQFSRRITAFIRQNSAMKALLNKSPIDTLQSVSIAPILAGTWKFTENGATPRTVVFSVTAGGQFRYKVGTDVIKNAVLFGPIIRLQNYPVTGQSMDIFKIGNNRYADLSKNYILK